MIAFFVILALLMVLVVVAGQWSGGRLGRPGRRVIYDRDVMVDRGPDVIEEEIVDDPYPRPAARSRRVVRRRRTY